MPEGDTLHTIAGYLRPRLEGKTLGPADSRAGPLAVVAPGATVTRVHVHGKHLLIDLDDGRAARVHLGMSGTWHHYKHDEPWKRNPIRARVVLTADTGVFVCFDAPTAELRRRAEIAGRIGRLGPDLLHPGVDFDEVVRRARAYQAESAVLADLLLDQRVASGIGNVYKSEVPFLMRVHPAAAVETLTEVTLLGAFERAAELLSWNSGGGPRTTTVDPRNVAVPPDRPRLYVYGRPGAPCLTCRTAIASGRLGRTARSTYWCPTCQPARGLPDARE